MHITAWNVAIADPKSIIMLSNIINNVGQTNSATFSLNYMHGSYVVLIRMIPTYTMPTKNKREPRIYYSHKKNTTLTIFSPQKLVIK